jgi:hypothetical protein
MNWNRSHLVEERAERFLWKRSILAIRIGFPVPPELRPGELLDQFLQRADPTRKGDEASARSNMICLRSCRSRVTSAPAPA